MTATIRVSGVCCVEIHTAYIRHIIVLMEDHTYERSFIGTTETTLGRSQMPQ